MKKNLEITNPRFNERIWPVPNEFVKSRFHCTWYEQLQFAISKVPGHHMLMIIGDTNTKVKSDNTNYGRAMGKRVERSMRMVTVLLVSV